MAEETTYRISKIATKLNVGIATLVDKLKSKGYNVDSNPNAKIPEEQYQFLLKEFQSSLQEKEEASHITIGTKANANVVIEKIDNKSLREEDEEYKLDINALKLKSEEKKAVIPTKNIAQKQVKPATPKQEIAPTIEQPKIEKPIEIIEKETIKETTTSVTPEKSVHEVEQTKTEETKSNIQTEPEPTTESPAQSASSGGIKVLGKIDLSAHTANKDKKKEPFHKQKHHHQDNKKQESGVNKQDNKDNNRDNKTQQPKQQDNSNQGQSQNQRNQDNRNNNDNRPKDDKRPPFDKNNKPTQQHPAPPKPPVIKEKLIEDTFITDEEDTTEIIDLKGESLKGLTVLGKIDLPIEKPKRAKEDDKKKRKRKRIKIAKNVEADAFDIPKEKLKDKLISNLEDANANNKKKKSGKKEKEVFSEKDIEEKLKATLAKMSGGKVGSASASASKKAKKEKRAAQEEEKARLEKQEATILRVTEFISASDLAALMDVSVNDVISACLSLGMFVSINQRLDAETIQIIAEEFGYEVQFLSDEDEIESDAEDIDSEDTLLPRAPIVTIMGHVDHGKTTLLDYIRKTRVTESEAGGITQHIGAYSVTTNSGKKITFLDTPGHEAFTAMRARGAKITDVAIIVIAADDNVMPQTKEAINHAQAAGVPIVFAINKIDKEGANVERIYEQLAQMNLLVEEWGGKYQSQKISAKKGLGIDELLEKVLLEAELLDLKSNPNKKASGTVIEASLDKGKGYVATMLVQNGKLSVGDVVLAGNHYGKVKAMYDDVGKRIKTAGPSTPVQILGLDGAPQAGDKFKVMDTEREAREIATKRQQVLREQTLRTRKHISLDEIGRRLALGNFKELRVIVKGDVDGSVEALSDSLLKLSTPEIQVSVLYKAVGQISESDVLLASASDAIIIGFQVRPSPGARKLAENEQIQIKLYSIIYNAINDIKAAMEGMLAPKTEEVILGTAEVKDTFKVSKVGTVAGCLVVEGSIKKSTRIRLIRDGIVIFTGDLDSLKRFKDDVAEVKAGTECGIGIKNFNDIKVGDIIESFEEREVKRTL